MKKLSCVAFVVVVCGFVGASAAADHAMFNKVSPDISKPAPSPHPEGWVPLARAGGETCATATVIGALPYSDDGTTLGAVDDYEEVCPYTSTSGDVVYSYSPAADVTVDATLCAGVTDYDTKLFVYQDVCPDGVPFACNDDDCIAPGGQDYVSALAGLNLLGGHTYYFVVDGYSGAEGNYTLEIAEGQPWASLNPCGATDLLFGQDPHNDDDGGWSFGSSTAAAWAAPGYAVYDNLETTHHEVCGINFHGLSLFNGGSWAACDPTAGGGMPFTIGFYPDAAGQPNTAAAICEYTGVIPNSITDSGLLFSGFSMYSFAIDALPSCCQLPASGTVWMMVRNEAMTGDCAFLWASSGNGLGDSSWQYDYDLATWDDTSGVDRAMCLYGTFWPVELQSFSIQ